MMEGSSANETASLVCGYKMEGRGELDDVDDDNKE